MSHVLTLQCPDGPGIVARIATFFFQHGGNIVHSDQHTGTGTPRRFFMRVEWEGPHPDAIRSDFSTTVGDALAAEWSMHADGYRPRLALFVSRELHCLQEILWQIRAGDIPADPSVVISNHPDAAPIAAEFDLPYRVVGQEDRTAEELAASAGSDFAVLARYMQILRPEFLAAYAAPVINIHHSFLPAFAGANPYRQAFERGVKRIGATAHYVTEELDAGPIIDQDVIAVDHRQTVRDLVRRGRQVERMVLARAAKLHAENRVLLDGNRTVVFG